MKWELDNARYSWRRGTNGIAQHNLMGAHKHRSGLGDEQEMELLPVLFLHPIELCCPINAFLFDFHCSRSGSYFCLCIEAKMIVYPVLKLDYRPLSLDSVMVLAVISCSMLTGSNRSFASICCKLLMRQRSQTKGPSCRRHRTLQSLSPR